MTKTISAAEARKRFGEITDRVTYSGEQYQVLKNGKPAVIISPAKPKRPKQTIDPSLEKDLKEFTEQYKEALAELASR